MKKGVHYFEVLTLSKGDKEGVTLVTGHSLPYKGSQSLAFIEEVLGVERDTKLGVISYETEKYILQCPLNSVIYLPMTDKEEAVVKEAIKNGEENNYTCWVYEEECDVTTE